MRLSLLHVCVLLVALFTASGAMAQVGTSSVGPGAPRVEDPGSGARPLEPAAPSGHDPQGSIVANGILGFSSGSNGTSFVVGAGIGYAVVDGLVPGVRGYAVLGNASGGELALTLGYTLSAGWYVSPFVVVEGGRRWFAGDEGWVVGAGGGMRLGYPTSRLTLRVGWVFRRFYVTSGDPFDASAPIVGVQFRF